MSGRAEHYGLPHGYSFTFTKDGKFVEGFVGPLAERSGFDGTVWWRLDHTGAPWKLDFQDKDLTVIQELTMTGQWLTSPLLTISQKGGDTFDLKVKQTGQSATLRIDSGTNLPEEVLFPVSSDLFSMKFSDWKAAGSVKVPGKIAVTTAGVTEVVDISEVSSTVKADFSMPAWTRRNITFDNTKPMGIEAKRALSGHVLVHPLLDGKDVGWFILDSCADTMVIDRGTANEAKLPKLGRLPMTGVGGTEMGTFRTVDHLTLGRATLGKSEWAELDLSGIGKLLNIKLAGIVGADLFKRSIVVMDLKGPLVEIYDPATYQLEIGSWTTLRFNTGNPALEASLEGGHKGWFTFDTGADGSVVFKGPFVREWRLLAGKETKTVGLGGVGGVIRAKLGEIDYFELGGHRFNKPQVIFADADKGAFNEPYLAGNIGQEMMMPFKMVFDFHGSRLALVPR